MYNYKLIIIFLLIFITIYLFCYKNEYFRNTNFTYLNDANKCCKISKVINKNATLYDNNYYKYKFETTNNCDTIYNNNYRIIKENDLLDDKIFNLNDCNNELKIGSCRKIGFECLDFMTENECKKYNMVWSDKLCNQLPKIEITYQEYEIIQT